MVHVRTMLFMAAVALPLGLISNLLAEDPAEPATPAEPVPMASAPEGVAALKVSGPYACKNLAVYLIHADDRDDRQFITLNEGLKSGKVKVTELKNEQVSKLMIENTSELPLFLQEGDRVTGGKQDRTVQSSLVIAANSGQQAIPAFCIEQSRWREGATGKAFVGNANIGYASNGVRFASKLAANQGRVWQQVAEQKAALQKKVGTDNDTTSLNEAIDSDKIVNTTKEYKEALGKVLAKHSDAVGVAFALDGALTEVNVFPGNPLLSKVYPRLLETYAVDAATSDKADKKTEAPTSAEIKKLMIAQVVAKPLRDEKIDAENQLEVFASDKAGPDKKHTFRCETKWGDQLIHLQWLRAEKGAAAAGPQQRGIRYEQNSIPNLNDFQIENANPNEEVQQQQIEVEPQQERQPPSRQ